VSIERPSEFRKNLRPAELQAEPRGSLWTEAGGRGESGTLRGDCKRGGCCRGRIKHRKRVSIEQETGTTGHDKEKPQASAFDGGGETWETRPPQKKAEADQSKTDAIMRITVEDFR